MRGRKLLSLIVMSAAIVVSLAAVISASGFGDLWTSAPKASASGSDPGIGDAFSVNTQGTNALTRLNDVRVDRLNRKQATVFAKVTIKNLGSSRLVARLTQNAKLVTADGEVVRSRSPVSLICGTRARHLRLEPQDKKSACVAFLIAPSQELSKLKLRLNDGASLMSWDVGK
jgi:hypothetical protein